MWSLNKFQFFKKEGFNMEKVMLSVPERCPKCMKDTMFVLNDLHLPVVFKIFFRITFDVRFRVEYCPNCGRLAVNVLK